MDGQLQNDGAPRATYADLLAAPESFRAEILDGALDLKPQPRNQHQRLKARLLRVLGAFDVEESDDGGWIFVDAPELHLGDDVLVPDLAAWRVERMAEPPDAAFFDLAPDWIGEILSPSTAHRDHGVKADAYARHGVAHYWIIDADAPQIEVFERTEAGLWLRLGVHTRGPAPQRAAIPPFAAAEIELSRLWPAPKKPPQNPAEAAV